MSAHRWDQESRLLSLDDDIGAQGVSLRLKRLTAQLATHLCVHGVSHYLLDERHPRHLKRWYRSWPGEHYNLLTALARIIRPSVIWEFGTFTGEGTISLHEGSPKSRIFTVDNVPREESWITPEDKSQITLINDDFLNVVKAPPKYLLDADLIFLDGPKDHKTEGQFLDLLAHIPFTGNPLLLMDDIREMALVYVWRNLPRSKIDLTSFGHFTGTGLIDWNAAVSPRVEA